MSPSSRFPRRPSFLLARCPRDVTVASAPDPDIRRSFVRSSFQVVFVAARRTPHAARRTRALAGRSAGGMATCSQALTSASPFCHAGSLLPSSSLTGIKIPRSAEKARQEGRRSCRFQALGVPHPGLETQATYRPRAGQKRKKQDKAWPIQVPSKLVDEIRVLWMRWRLWRAHVCFLPKQRKILLPRRIAADSSVIRHYSSLIGRGEQQSALVEHPTRPLATACILALALHILH